MKLSKKKSTILCILDGFGLGDPKSPHNAVALAHTPCLDHLLSNYPVAQITTSGLAIGLPEGQMGNSEVGHMTIGSGRILEQNLTRINRYFNTGKIEKLASIEKIIASKNTIHIIGVASPGGVHAHITHIIELAKLFSANNISVKIHAISDGRDVGQRDALNFLPQLKDICSSLKNVTLSTICGRYYAMDRDDRYDRTQLAYDLYTQGRGKKVNDITAAIKDLYTNGIYDELFPPMISEEFSGIKDGETILFANFRPDRMRQILQSFLMSDFPYFPRSAAYQKLAVFTMTAYFNEEKMPAFYLKPQSIFDNIIIKDNLAATIAHHGYTQLHIAETEKYAHVTFFLNGGIESRNPHEDWLLLPSPKVDSYDTTPEMAALQISQSICDNMNKYDFIIANLANCDMVGHTGNFSATIKAVTIIDDALHNIVSAAIKHDHTVMITADHGNAEIMVDQHNMPHTQHTTLPVPLIVVDRRFNKDTTIQSGTLADIAPTLLHLNSIPIPLGMTGNILISNNAS